MFDVVSARRDPARMERMKPITDRIVKGWGVYLPEVGWDELLLQLDEHLVLVDPGYVVYQAKEKFGTLRFYAGHSDDFWDRQSEEDAKKNDLAFDGFILWAEHKSALTCEYCGEPGEVRRLPWIKTLCEEHYQEKVA